VNEHDNAMRHALRLARFAGRRGEVPVGAIVVRDGKIMGVGCNQRETKLDPVAHAEIQAIRGAARRVGSWRLEGCVLYVTMEPCAMCAGACVNARVAKIVYGCSDPKAGYVASLGSIATDPRLNHRCDVVGGVLAAECGEELRRFFQARRRGPGPLANP
jgi:tRNA(adenine34) deaminase